MSTFITGNDPQAVYSSSQFRTVLLFIIPHFTLLFKGHIQIDLQSQFLRTF